MNRLKLLLVFVSFSIASYSLSAQSTKDSAKVSAQSTEVIITQPEYVGGIDAMYKYIKDNFVYPDEAAKRWVSGTIEVEFTIEKSGDVNYVSILEGLEDSIDKEMLRLLQNMPRWTPATRNGTPVRYKVAMSLNLRLSRNKNGAKS